MLVFLVHLWRLARAYRGGLLLGVFTGIIGGLIEPLMIATIAFVYAMVFPSAQGTDFAARMSWAPDWLRHWANSAQQAFTSGLKSHPVAIIALVAAIPAVVTLLLPFSRLNVYFLQLCDSW